jgi:energy-converting hydrogenase Eha subunit E
MQPHYFNTVALQTQIAVSNILSPLFFQAFIANRDKKTYNDAGIRLLPATPAETK